MRFSEDALVHTGQCTSKRTGGNNNIFFQEVNIFDTSASLTYGHDSTFFVAHGPSIRIATNFII